VSFRFESPTEVIEIRPTSNGLDSREIPLFRSTANLTISITDDDDVPLEGVNVTLKLRCTDECENLHVSAVSDVDGHAVFTDLPVGDMYDTTINDPR
jgi:hypothetical protein